MLMQLKAVLSLQMLSKAAVLILIIAAPVPLSLTTANAHKSYHFTMNNPDDGNSRVIFYMGSIVDTIYIDNISLKEDVANGVKDAVSIPDQFKLEQNYPNPFNPITIIPFPIAGRQYSLFCCSYNL